MRRAMPRRHRERRAAATRARCSRSMSGSTRNVGIVARFVGLEFRHADDRRFAAHRWRAARGMRIPESPAGSCPIRSRQACRRPLRCEPAAARSLLDFVRAAFDFDTSRQPGRLCSRRPIRSAMICCVRSASVADSSVGSASASSRPLQCSDCAPPSTAASACTVTRTRLLSGCCAVSVLPAVWA